MSGSPVVLSSYEEPRRGDRVGLLVDSAATKYCMVGTVLSARRGRDGDVRARVRWEGDFVDTTHADALIVIRQAAS